MDQIGLALSRRKLPRKPFSRRVCFAGCALNLPRPRSAILLRLCGPPAFAARRVIILLLRNILETPVGFCQAALKGI